MKYKAVLIDVWTGIELYSVIYDDITTAQIALKDAYLYWSCCGITCQSYIEMLLFDDKEDL